MILPGIEITGAAADFAAVGSPQNVDVAMIKALICFKIYNRQRWY
jgi:hypothetical protein